MLDKYVVVYVDGTARSIWGRNKPEVMATAKTLNPGLKVAGAVPLGRRVSNGVVDPAAIDVDQLNRDLTDSLDLIKAEPPIPLSPLQQHALVWAQMGLVDEYLQGLSVVLRPQRQGAPKPVEEILALQYLPQRFARHYDVLFAKRFFLTLVNVMHKMAGGRYAKTDSVAEELALHVIITEAKVRLEIGRDAGDLHPTKADADFGVLYERLVEDTDFMMLYEQSLDGIEDDRAFGRQFGVADLRVEKWFVPYGEGKPLPYSDDKVKWLFGEPVQLPSGR